MQFILYSKADNEKKRMQFVVEQRLERLIKPALMIVPDFKDSHIDSDGCIHTSAYSTFYVNLLTSAV